MPRLIECERALGGYREAAADPGFKEGNLATGMRISKEICTASRRTFQSGFDQDLVH